MPRVPLALVVVLLLVVGGGSATAAKLITGKQIANSSITGIDIKDHSLTAKDFKGALPSDRPSAGPKGDQGAPGEKGAPGAPGGPGEKGEKGDKGSDAFGSLVYKSTGPYDNPSGATSGGFADCPDGMAAIGGGAIPDGDGQSVAFSGPMNADGSTNPQRWYVWMGNGGGDSAFDVKVICAPAGKIG